LLSLLSPLISPLILAGQHAPAVTDFDALLAESQLLYAPPPGYTALPAARNPLLDYEAALRSGDGGLEIRIALRPLDRLHIDYDDPHGAIPDPNHIFPLVFESLASKLSAGRYAPSNEYPPDQAHSRFNADWAAAAMFDVDAEFESAKKLALLIALHRNKVADAYIILLFDDYAELKAHLDAAMATLRFYPVVDGGAS